MRKYLCASVALVLALAIAGCGGSKGKAGETASHRDAGSSKSYAELRWGMPTFPGTIDFYKTPYGQTFAAESLAVQGLMEFEPDGKVKPGLASSVEQPDPTTYIYHLKSVKFSDGAPMVASDVVFSLDRNIDGKEAWTKSYWTDVVSISAPNDSTVVVKLKRPSAIFQDIVAFSSPVMEKASAERMGEQALGTPGHMPIGTGPWKLDSYKPEANVQLSRNPYWVGPRPPAEKVSLEFFKTEAALALALRSGAIDGASEYVSPKTFANIAGTRKLTAPGGTVMLMVANTMRPPFNDVHVRRAIAYATDVKGMIGVLYPHGEAAVDPTIMPASLFSNLGSQSEVSQTLATLQKYEFDLSMAKQELAKSAYPHGFTTPIEVAQVNESGIAAAQILAADLAKIGVKANVKELTAGQEVAWLTGKVTLAVVNTGTVYDDPEGIMSTRIAPGQIYPPGGGQNIANYRNPEVDKLLAESVETLNRQRRLQMVGKLLGIMNSEAPYWPLYSPATLSTLSEKYVFSGFSYWSMYFSPWALNVKLAS
jgi:peptide/nickel transport system substrate-binding protein